MKTIGIFFKWIFYVLITRKERHCWKVSKIFDCDVYDYTDYPGGHQRKYHYDKSMPPYKRFLSRSEFWKHEMEKKIDWKRLKKTKNNYE